MKKRGHVRTVFGLQLQHARQRAGFKSAEQFAHKLGMEPAAYRKYERGEASPTLETIVLICQELGCTPNFLLPAAAEGHAPRCL